MLGQRSHINEAGYARKRRVLHAPWVKAFTAEWVVRWEVRGMHERIGHHGRFSPSLVR